MDRVEVAASPSLEVLIRQASPHDWERIAEITVGAYVQGGFLTSDNDYILDLSDVRFRAENSLLLVAEITTVDGTKEIAASVAVTDSHGPMAEVSQAGELEFRMLAVDPRFQGHGIARKIVRHIVEMAESRADINAVVLCSMKAMTIAHGLYRDEGFRELPERDFHLESKGLSFPFFIRTL